MLDSKRKKLVDKGWTVGSTSEFLELTPEDEMIIALRLTLTQRFRELREEQGISQRELARRMETSQPRISQIENHGDSVTFDTLIRGLIALGLDHKQLGTLIAGSPNLQKAST